MRILRKCQILLFVAKNLRAMIPLKHQNPLFLCLKIIFSLFKSIEIYQEIPCVI